MNPDVTRAKELARFYSARGFAPLPSRTDDKRPLCCFAEYWDSMPPADLFDRFDTTNIQIITGRFYRLLVIDLDGPEAITRWESMGCTPRTWITSSGGGGRHLWFRLPPNYPTKLPKAFLWKGEGNHSAIERLCDQSLVMAPPSIHPKTGKRYTFADHDHSPFSLPMPADVPGWVLRLPPLSNINTVNRFAHGMTGPSSARGAVSLSADPVTIAKGWGIKFTGKVSRSGWAECHAFDRDDAKPSAAIHTESGAYCDLGSGVKLSLAGLGVTLHQFTDIKDALSQLRGSHVGATR